MIPVFQRQPPVSTEHLRRRPGPQARVKVTLTELVKGASAFGSNSQVPGVSDHKRVSTHSVLGREDSAYPRLQPKALVLQLSPQAGF